MPTLDATVGGASANSYAAVADADVYFDERLKASAWTGESDVDVKERGLIMATRRLDAYDFEGVKASTAQALKWPRIDAFDEDGEEYDTSAIPAVVLRATYELALHFLNEVAESVDPLAPTGLEGYDSARLGPLEVELNHAERSGSVPDHVRRILAPVLRSAGFSVEMERA